GVGEVAAGEPLDGFFAERTLEPLGMTDTRFWVEAPAAQRLAALYVPDSDRKAARNDVMGKAALRSPTCLSGGGGLVGTAGDYHPLPPKVLCGGGRDEGRPRRAR